MEKKIEIDKLLLEMEKEVVLAVNKARRRVLDIDELAIGTDHPKWKITRNQTLKVFGESGLEGAVHKIFKKGI
jgi:hypothetical protein